MPRRKPTVKRNAWRPLIDIDWNEVDEMLEAHVSGPIIADALGICVDTLYKRCQSEKGITFSLYATAKRGGGKAKLAKRQYLSAMQGNTTMLVLLGEEWINQGQQAQVQTINLVDLRSEIDDGKIAQE